MLCHYKHRIGGTATFWFNFPSILSSKWQLPAHYSINHRSERGPFLWSQKPHGTIGGVFFCIQSKELVFSNNTKKKLSSYSNLLVRIWRPKMYLAAILKAWCLNHISVKFGCNSLSISKDICKSLWYPILW